ncbi:efflux RND transporter periplasmic adaptor subunit [Thiorhodospira sibirica]|uniref:efflux RND transporter periplasmic adaptor subunit n=1 Tax=Thiorhodospira sibirica TaxID=154347 RepID=UPI00022C404D|nr:efflux RND transporter periplasmic adaptor subunit [Thiorhodospira sibirica]
MKKLLTPLILLLAGVAAGAYVLYGPKPTPLQTASRPPMLAHIPVTIATVEYRSFASQLEALGTARANESVELSPRVTAPVSEILFNDGMQVSKGQVLLRLASAEERADLREAEVRLHEQQRELERIRVLVAERNLPRQRLDEQESRVNEAKARLEAVQARLAHYVLHAPFAGVLGLRTVSVGAMVGPNTVVATLDDLHLIKLDFQVPETFLPSLRPGQVIRARSAAFPGQEFSGQVGSIDSRINVQTRTVMVRAEIPNPDGLLRPGMLLVVTVYQDPRDSLSIPEGALVPVRDEQHVYVLTANQRVERRRVELGRRGVGYVEVLQGLEAGVQVVVEGTHRLRPGAAIQVMGEHEPGEARS